MHGAGVFRWNDGRVYEGHFVNDKKEGYGELKWGDGRKYEGQWKNGKQDGMGFFTSSDGVKQKGNWSEGRVQFWLNEQGERINTNSSDNNQDK